MQSNLALHQARLISLWQRTVRIVGIHTMNVLLERAICDASHAHPELTLIQHDDDSFDLTAFGEASAGRSDVEVAEAFDDLFQALLLILARLLGKEMAQRLAEELENRTPRPG